MDNLKLIGKSENGEVRLEQNLPIIFDRTGNDITKKVVALLCQCGMPTLLSSKAQCDFKGSILPVPVGFYHNAARIWHELAGVYSSDAYKNCELVNRDRLKTMLMDARPHVWLKLPAIMTTVFSGE